mmetsp:Transcript_6889/g.19935  ORF Transcript_6889/g.19935 Transcript_6889/m.19935 type:complete len:251 (-) Transcript_6889:2689-3441(-)
MNDGGIAGAYESPLGTKVGIQGENSVAVGIGAHKELVDQRMVVREGTSQGEVLAGNPLDLLLLVFVLPVFVVHVRVVVYRPFGTIETVRAEWKGSGRSTDRVQAELKVASLNCALSSGPLFDVPTDGQRIDGLGELVVQSRWRAGDVRQVASRFPASGERLANVFELGETRAEQQIHATNVLDKEMELFLEHLNGAMDDHLFFQVTRRNLVALPFDIGPNLGKDQSTVDLVIALAQDESQFVGNESAPGF